MAETILLPSPASAPALATAHLCPAPSSERQADYETEWCPPPSAARPPWANLEADWRACHRRYTPDDIGGDIDWCRASAAIYPRALHVLVVRRRGVVVGVVPMVLKPVEFDCQLGEWRWLRLRPRVLELSGDAPALPAEPAAVHSWFAAIDRHRHRYDALALTLPLASPLAAFLEGAAFDRWGWRPYRPHPVAAHHLIRMPASFHDYLAKFTPKTRKNRLRELKYLEAKGPVELVRCTTPAAVDSFLAEAGAISRRSYQHKLLGAGLREPDRLRCRLELAAARGWLRSYILRCGGVACSYMLAYQYEGKFNYTKVGYDPAWRDLCVGSVLQLLVLQDLFAERTPALFDFGSQGPQKQYFGNDFYHERLTFLFNPRPYPLAARALHSLSRRANAAGARWLARYGAKHRVNQWLRSAAGC